MSQRLIDRSPDLIRLQNDGYDVEVFAGHLVLRDVPYLDANRCVRRGLLVSTLTLAGEATAAPDDHVALFAGDYPCDASGSMLEKIRHQSGKRQLGGGLEVDHSFSSKPVTGRYADYYEKMTTYVAIISSPVRSIDPTATARLFKPVGSPVADDVFEYIDTASSRAGINIATAKLAGQEIAIVGLGGTGSYVVDLVSKTPVRRIHLFDGDRLFQHNAFRVPGAVSLEELRLAPNKANYFAARYSAIHRGIVAHDYHIGARTLDELNNMDCVFVCIDRAETKQLLIPHLERSDVTFIDVGMGVELVDSSIRGVIRVTASTPTRRDHVRRRISLSSAVDNDYSLNIQIADLNALNATLAVIKWKKLRGFYLDFVREGQTTYTVDCGMLVGDDSSN